MEKTHAHVLPHYKSGTTRLHRPLGPLETMYHLYHKRGIDIIAQLICLETYSHVTTNEIKQALVILMKCHPLLRMSIHEKTSVGGRWFHFYEMEPHRIDLSETNERNWEKVLSSTISKPFDIENGPLWRIKVVREEEEPTGSVVNLSNSTFTHRLVFVFGCHHSIADGIYLRDIYADFITVLDKVKQGEAMHCEKQSLFLPPIENILSVIYPDPRSNNAHAIKTNLLTQRCNCLCECVHSVEALDAYQSVYKMEISRLSRNKQETAIIRIKLTDFQSQNYLLNCKSSNVTVTAASISAACIALSSLLKTSLPDELETLVVPVEIMVNLRRYVTDKTRFESYPGVAAIHIPLIVSVPLKTRQNENAFWNIASKCTRDIYEIVSSAKPIETMIKESENELKNKSVIGKSPFVICLTNLSSVDNVVKPELQDRYKLVAFPGMTNITVNDMPIFFINVFTLNRQFNVGVGYCSSYTSQDTAVRYICNLRQCLGSVMSKL